MDFQNENVHDMILSYKEFSNIINKLHVILNSSKMLLLENFVFKSHSTQSSSM